MWVLIVVDNDLIHLKKLVVVETAVVPEGTHARKRYSPLRGSSAPTSSCIQPRHQLFGPLWKLVELKRRRLDAQERHSPMHRRTW